MLANPFASFETTAFRSQIPGSAVNSLPSFSVPGERNAFRLLCYSGAVKSEYRHRVDRRFVPAFVICRSDACRLGGVRAQPGDGREQICSWVARRRAFWPITVRQSRNRPSSNLRSIPEISALFCIFSQCALIHQSNIPFICAKSGFFAFDSQRGRMNKNFGPSSKIRPNV